MLILEASKWRALEKPGWHEGVRVEGAPHTVQPLLAPRRGWRMRREAGGSLAMSSRPQHCVQSHINGRPEEEGRLSPGPGRLLLMGSWYVLAVASGEKDFALEKATKSVEGVEVMLTSQNTLKMRASRHRLESCHLQAVELRRQNSGWVFRNPSLGVLEYRVLGTNFRDYAIVFTQLEAQEEAFSTVELYSRTALASQEALGRFAKWSRSLGFLSQQQAELQRDFTCARKVFP
uniref:Lipocalin/cytosolic fatty-acid binding domain-containing protein n=1 Tax=Capra hircus TaxID=9925 RepID=A0A8C2NV13_CAPHI